MNRHLFLSFSMLMACCFSPKTSDAQIFSTKLRVTVVDELGNVVKGAKVTLYATQADYNKEVNPIQSFKLTDAKGRVTFKKLKRRAYYVIVRKEDKDNSGGGEIISGLKKGRLNKATVVISDGI